MNIQRVKRAFIALLIFVFFYFFIPIRLLEYKFFISTIATFLFSFFVLFSLREYRSFSHFIQVFDGKDSTISPKVEGVIFGLLLLPLLFIFYFRTMSMADNEIDKNIIVHKAVLVDRYSIDRIVKKRGRPDEKNTLEVEYSYNGILYHKNFDVDYKTFEKLKGNDSIYIEFSKRVPEIVRLKN
jgi:hypothetical protein